MSIGKSFLAAVVASGDVSAILQSGPIAHLFRGNEIEPFTFVLEFVKQYGSVPKADTILAHTGEELPAPTEPALYFRDLMEVRHVEIALKNAMKASSEALQPNGAGSDAALASLTKAVLDLVNQKHGNQLADLRQAYDLLMGVFYTQWNGGGDGLALGWPYLDAMTGGMVKGDLISYVGRPAMGKSWQMLYGCHYGWHRAQLDKNHPGSSRLFVSMEMNVIQIEQRLAAMHMSIPADQIKKGALSKTGVIKFKKGLKELEGYKAPFWIVDGNLTATVGDIQALAQQLKPDAIFIDGAYLLQHPYERDRYKRVAQNVDLIKQLLTPIAPTVCSWQFKRSESKSKKTASEDKDLEDIGMSDAIPQHSSLVLGLFEDDTVETLKQRKVRVLKGRSGETGAFTTRFKFDTMDFSQVDEMNLEDVKFV